MHSAATTIVRKCIFTTTILIDNCTEIITAGIYWTMFETGLGLIVICLPSLYILSRSISKGNVNREASSFDREIRATTTIVMAPASGYWAHDSAISVSDYQSPSASSAEKTMETGSLA